MPKAAPSFLDELAKAEWARVTPLLEEVGLVTHLDLAAVSAYCQSWSRYVQAEQALAESGPVLTTHTGIKYLSPHAKLARAAAQQMRSLAGELGLTPSSRSRIRVTPPAPKTDLQRFRERHGR